MSDANDHPGGFVAHDRNGHTRYGGEADYAAALKDLRRQLDLMTAERDTWEARARMAEMRLAEAGK